MKNRNTALFLSALTLLCLMTGCGNNASEKSSTEQAISSEESSVLSPSIHLLGNDITLPCEFSKLGKLRFETSFAVAADDNGLYGAVYSGDSRIGRIIVSDCSTDDKNIDDKIVTYLELKPDFGFDDLDVEYSGLTYKTSKDSMIASFGQPDEEYDNNICYYLENGGYVEFEFTRDLNTEIESIKIKAK